MSKKAVKHAPKFIVMDDMFCEVRLCNNLPPKWNVTRFVRSVTCKRCLKKLRSKP